MATTPWLAFAIVFFGLCLVLAGLILSWESSQLMSSVALAIAGILWPLGWIDSWGGGPRPLIAMYAPPLAIILGAYAMYRYPDPVLLRHKDRRWLAILVIWVFVGRTLVVVTSRPSWYDEPESSWWPNVIEHRQTYDTVLTISHTGNAILALAFLVAWIQRTKKATRLPGSFALPPAAAGVIAGVTQIISSLISGYVTDPLFKAAASATHAWVLSLVPIAFVFSVLRRRLTFESVGRLIQDIAGRPTPVGVQECLRSALGVPDLTLVFFSRDMGSYVNVHGTRTDIHSIRVPSLPIRASDGKLLATIFVPSLGQIPAELVASVLSAGALAIENAQLQAELQAHLAEARASRLRIVEAALLERRRLERDLHDGAQQRLLALKLSLAAIQSADPERAKQLLAQARADAGSAVDELRALARGLHPPLLTQAGLAAAVEANVERLKIRSRIDLPTTRYPFAVEATGYYVISEALTNIIRHADATSVQILGDQMGQWLRIVVQDDGVGGASLQRGTGLQGLSDRVQALGGTLTIESPQARGTAIIAELPCE